MGQLKAHGWTAVAGADLSTKQGKLVKIGSANHTVIECDANTDIPVGVIEQDQEAASGENVGLQVTGVARCLVGTGGATRGALQTWVSDGCTDAAASTENTFGVALETGAAGVTIDVLLNLGNITNTIV